MKIRVIIVAVVIVMLVSAGLALDYRNQRQKLRNLRSPVERIEDAASVYQPPTSVQALLRQLQQARDELVACGSYRWISEEIYALDQRLDYAEKKLRALESGRYQR